jgi:hypothetical protein
MTALIIPATKSNFLDGYTVNSKKYNYGLATTMLVSGESGGYYKNSIFQFDLSGLDPATIVNSAIVSFWTAFAGVGQQQQLVLMPSADADWVAGVHNGAAGVGESCWNWFAYATVPWSGGLGAGGGTFIAAFDALPTQYAEKQITLDPAMVQAWIGPAGSLLWALLNSVASAQYFSAQVQAPWSFAHPVSTLVARLSTDGSGNVKFIKVTDVESPTQWYNWGAATVIATGAIPSSDCALANTDNESDQKFRAFWLVNNGGVTEIWWSYTANQGTTWATPAMICTTDSSYLAACEQMLFYFNAGALKVRHCGTGVVWHLHTGPTFSCTTPRGVGVLYDYHQLYYRIAIAADDKLYVATHHRDANTWPQQPTQIATGAIREPSVASFWYHAVLHYMISWVEGVEEIVIQSVDYATFGAETILPLLSATHHRANLTWWNPTKTMYAANEKSVARLKITLGVNPGLALKYQGLPYGVRAYVSANGILAYRPILTLDVTYPPPPPPPPPPPVPPPYAIPGSGIILLVNTGTWAAPVFEPLAEQRVVDFGEGNDVIDWSSKDSRFRRIMPGRYSSDVSAGGLYVPDDPPYLALQGAMRGHELILIRRCEDGVPIEDAIALVKAISIDAPDNDVGLMAVGLVVDGWWFPAVP